MFSRVGVVLRSRIAIQRISSFSISKPHVGLRSSVGFSNASRKGPLFSTFVAEKGKRNEENADSKEGKSQTMLWAAGLFAFFGLWSSSSSKDDKPKKFVLDSINSPEEAFIW